MFNKEQIKFEYGFESVLNNLNDVFFLLNKEFHLLYLNPRAKSFINLEKIDSYVTFWDVFPFEPGSKLSEALTYTLLEHKEMSGDFYSGIHFRWFKITVSPYQNGFSVLIADIHEQKLLHEKLKRNEKAYSLILNFLPHIAFITNSNGEASYLNERWIQYTGKSLEEGLGLNWEISYHPDDYQSVLQCFSENQVVSRPFEIETRIKNSKGEYRWHLERIIPVPDKNGKADIWIGTATDIHDHKITTEKLEEAEIIARLGSFEALLDQSAIVNSPGARRILGLPPDMEATLEYIESISNPDDIKAVRKVINKAIKNRLPYEYTRRIFLPSAGMRYIYCKGRVIYDENNNPIKLFGIVQDVTERAVAEAAFKEQHHFAQKIAEASPDIIVVTEIETFKITYSNIKETSGGYHRLSLLELSGTEIKSLIHPEDEKSFEKYVSEFKLAKDDDIKEIECRAKDAYGDWRWLKTRGKIFQRNQRGLPTHFISVTQDITEDKLKEKELKESQGFINAIFDASPDLIIVYDALRKTIRYVNNKNFSDLGYNSLIENVFTGQDFENLVHPEDLQYFRNYYTKLINSADDNVQEIEYRFKENSGQWRWLRERGKVFQRNQKGDVNQFLVFIQEITEQKEAQERLIQNELLNKLVEKKEEFMSVASHELKTPITTIKASMQIMKRLVEKHTDEKTLLVFISKALLQINKLTSMIGDLLDNTKIQAGKISLNIAPFFVQELIDEVVTHNSNQHRIIIRNDLEEPVEGDKIRLEQVLTNFLTNAVKYSPEGKEVLIEVEKDGNYAKISVTDYGIGIPEEKLPYVFDRFYRVEEKSQKFSGLGLGLYISAEIINQHHGEYGVFSRFGEMSTFWFKIPILHS